MRRFAIPLLALSLGACATTTVIDDEERAMSSEPAAAFNLSEPVEIDRDKSYVSFLGRSNIINHEGEFETFDVTMDLDDTTPSDLTKAEIGATIDIASVHTDADGLTGHLQKADFFDAENHPQATFESTSIVAKGENKYDIKGDLTVKGVTKEVTLDSTITDEYLIATFDLPRKEFGVGNDSYGDKLLNEEVPVEVRAVFMQ